MVRIVIKTGSKRSSPEPPEGRHKRQKSTDRTSASTRPSDFCPQEQTGASATEERSSVSLELTPSVPSISIYDRETSPAEGSLPQNHRSPDCQIEKIKCETEALRERIEQVCSLSTLEPLEALERIHGIVSVQEVEILFDKTLDWARESEHECSHLHPPSQYPEGWVVHTAWELQSIREDVLRLYTWSLQAAAPAARGTYGGDDLETQRLEDLCERLTSRYGSTVGLEEETLGEQMELDDPV